MTYVRLNFEALYEENGWLCTPAYGGFFVNTPDGIFYFESETGEVRQVLGNEMEFLTLCDLEEVIL